MLLSKDDRHWRDEHPDRYGPIEPGDYAGTMINGTIHFIPYTNGPADWPVWPYPDGSAPCGVKLPDDWPDHRRDFPIAGIVNCPVCLEAAQGDACR